jgi:epoxyqueuosine reductase
LAFKGKFDNWIFGCDICQQVCPWNRLAEPHNEPAFNPTEELHNMRKPDWEELTEEKFNVVFKESPLKRAKFRGMRRNIKFVKQSY